MLENRVFTLKDLYDNGTGSHEVHQLAEERTRLVNGIEGFGLLASHADSFLGDDSQSRFFDQRVDGAGQITCRCVRLDDGEGAFDRHDVVLTRSRQGKLRAYIGAVGARQAKPTGKTIGLPDYGDFTKVNPL